MGQKRKLNLFGVIKMTKIDLNMDEIDLIYDCITDFYSMCDHKLDVRNNILKKIFDLYWR